MKIILSESQYNRIFNNKKRKLIITESQYKSILNEVELSSNFNKYFSRIKDNDIIKLTDGNKQSLHFRVITTKPGELIMINCNDGVYKNSYFYITPTSYSNSSLTYKIAQDKNINDDTDPLETINDNSIWRNSTFKNITNIEVYVDNKQGCNLSDTAKKKFSINDNANDENKPIDFKEFLDNLFRDGFKIDSWYKAIFHDDSFFKFKVLKQQGADVSIMFQDFNGKPMETNGFAERWLKPLRDSDAYEQKDDNDSLILTIDDIKEGKSDKFSKELMTFDFPIVIKYDNGKSKKFMFNGAKKFERIIKDEKSFKGGKVKEKLDIPDFEPTELSDEELKELIDKYFTDDKILKNTLISKPNKFLELIRVSRKKGIIPAQSRLAEWGLYASNQARDIINNKRFKINETHNSKLISYNKVIDDAPTITENEVFKVKVLKKQINNDDFRLGTNFEKKIGKGEYLKFYIYLTEILNETKTSYLYQYQLYSKDIKKIIAKGRIEIEKPKEEKNTTNNVNNPENKK